MHVLSDEVILSIPEEIDKLEIGTAPYYEDNVEVKINNSIDGIYSEDLRRALKIAIDNHIQSILADFKNEARKIALRRLEMDKEEAEGNLYVVSGQLDRLRGILNDKINTEAKK